MVELSPAHSVLRARDRIHRFHPDHYDVWCTDGVDGVHGGARSVAGLCVECRREAEIAAAVAVLHVGPDGATPR